MEEQVLDELYSKLNCRIHVVTKNWLKDNHYPLCGHHCKLKHFISTYKRGYSDIFIVDIIQHGDIFEFVGAFVKKTDVCFNNADMRRFASKFAKHVVKNNITNIDTAVHGFLYREYDLDIHSL